MVTKKTGGICAVLLTITMVIICLLPAVSTADMTGTMAGAGDLSAQAADAETDPETSAPTDENGAAQEGQTDTDQTPPSDEEAADDVLNDADGAEDDLSGLPEQTDPAAPVDPSAPDEQPAPDDPITTDEPTEPTAPTEPTDTPDSAVTGDPGTACIEQTLSTVTDDGMTVTAAGYMPAAAQLSVATVPADIAAAYIDSGSTIVFAYDIKLLLPAADDSWIVYQPEQPLTVSIVPDAAAERPVETPVEVTHVSVDESTQQAAVTKVPAIAQADGAVTFAAEHFSYYIGTVLTASQQVLLTDGAGYAFYADPACTEPISGEQPISAAAAIYLKAEESYQIQTVAVMGADGSLGIGLIEPGDGAAYDHKITFPETTEPAQPAQLITVQVMQTLWYNGGNFYNDAACTISAGEPSDLPERVNSAATTLWINMLTNYTPDGAVSLDGQDNIVLLTRDANYPGALFTIPSGAQLTLSHITLDGGALWSGEPDAVLERGTINSGLSAGAPLITVDGSLIMSTGATLQNNDNTASPGGAVYVSANGAMTMTDGVIGSNAASSPDNGYGGAIYSQAKGVAATPGLTISGGHISGNQASCASTSGRGGSIQLDGASLAVQGGTIAHNKTSGSGGGISLAGGSSLIMNGGVIDSNYAFGAGGGIYADPSAAEGCAITLNDGAISHNQAISNGGGGLYLSPSGSTACTITGGVISANTATTNGGAVYGSKNLLIMSGGAITADNHADGDGSDGFYFYPEGKVLLSGAAAVSAPFSRSGQSDDTSPHIYIAGGLTGQIFIRPHSYDQGSILASGLCSLLGNAYRDYPVTASDAAALMITEDSFGSTYHAEVDAAADQLVLAADASLPLTLSADAVNVSRGESCTITAAASGAEVSQVQWSVSGGQSSATLLSTSGNGSAVLSIGADETAPSVTVTAVLPLADGTMQTSQLSVTVAADLPPAENKVNGLTAAAAPATFTVSIPEAIPLTSEQGSFQINASGSGTEAAPVTVTVTSSSAFKLQAADTQAALPYTLYRDNAYQDAITDINSTAAVFDGTALSASIYYQIDTTNTPIYGGTYSDTLTFTITPSN